MKKILSKIGEFFEALLAILFALVLGICVIFMLPLDYIRYKRSYFYKNERKRYTMFAGSGFYFEIYNEIAKNNLPIKYIFNPTTDNIFYGWFVYDKTLLVVGAIPEYYADVQKWFCGEFDDGHDTYSIPLDEYLKREIDEINESLGYDVCDKAIILINASNIDVELAKGESSFLIYDDNREEALRNLCKM